MDRAALKVLLVFPQRDGQTGVSIKRAFLQQGCEVVVVDAKTEARNMLPEAARFKPDLVFCSRTPALARDMEQLVKLHPATITACWNVDVRASAKAFGNDLLQLFRAVHVLYSKPKGLVKEYQSLCPTTLVKTLQQGIDQEVYQKEELSAADQAIYGCEVAFMGRPNKLYQTPAGGRIALINHVKKQAFDLKLYGYNTATIYDSAHNKACVGANIVLGHTGFAHIAQSNSVRDFKVLGAGGFLLTEHVLDSEAFFEPGVHCDTYRTKEECVEKIRHYLANPDLRERIATAGHKHVHAHHRYLDRIRTVVEDVHRMQRENNTG